MLQASLRGAGRQGRGAGRLHLLGRRAAVRLRRRGQIPRRPEAALPEHRGFPRAPGRFRIPRREAAGSHPPFPLPFPDGRQVQRGLPPHLGHPAAALRRLQRAAAREGHVLCGPGLPRPRRAPAGHVRRGPAAGALRAQRPQRVREAPDAPPARRASGGVLLGLRQGLDQRPAQQILLLPARQRPRVPAGLRARSGAPARSADPRAERAVRRGPGQAGPGHPRPPRRQGHRDGGRPAGRRPAGLYGRASGRSLGVSHRQGSRGLD